MRQLLDSFVRAIGLSYKIALLGFVFLVVGGLYIRYTETLHDGDIYFSMAYGRQYLQDHTLRIDENQFRWVPYCKGKGTDGIYPSWIPHIIFYLVFKSMGYHGLYLLRFFVIACIFLLYFLMARKLKVFDYAGVLLLLLFVSLSMSISGLMIKADIFSVLFMSIEAYLLYSYRLRQDNRILFVFPVLFLLWANSHISVIVGLGIFALWSVLSLIFSKGANTSRRLFLTAIASGLMLFLTNKPLFLWKFIIGRSFSKLFSSALAKSSGNIGSFKYIMAFQSVSVSKDDIAFIWISGLCLVFFAVFIWWLMQKRKEWNTEKSVLWEVFILVPMVVFNFKLVRISYVLGIWGFFASCFAVSRIKDSIEDKKLWINILALALLFFFVNKNFAIYREKGLMGPGTWTPVLEMEYIKSHIPTGKNIFTTTFVGSYVIWEGYPDYKCYFDSRMGRILPDYIRMMSGEESKMRSNIAGKYDVALVSFWEWNFMLDKFIRDKEHWKPVFWGPAGVVFVKRDIYPELRWQSPDYKGVRRYMQWDTFISRLIAFLILEGHIDDAESVLEISRDWYAQEYDYWQIIIKISTEMPHIANALYGNLDKIVDMPDSVRHQLLVLIRFWEYYLFDVGNYSEALRLQDFTQMVSNDIGITIYNKGIIKYAMGEYEESRILFDCYKKLVAKKKGSSNRIPDRIKETVDIADDILSGKDVKLSSDILF